MNLKIKAIIVIMTSLLLISGSIAIWALFFKEDKILKPDVPNEIDKTQKEDKQDKIEGDDNTQEETDQNSISIMYAQTADVSLSGEYVSFYFANPSKSNQDVIIQIVIQDNVIAQSDVINPGYQLTQLSLINKQILATGGYDGEIMAYYYDEKTGEKSMINTKMPVTINVVE